MASAFVVVFRAEGMDDELVVVCERRTRMLSPPVENNTGR